MGSCDCIVVWHDGEEQAYQDRECEQSESVGDGMIDAEENIFNEARAEKRHPRAGGQKVLRRLRQPESLHAVRKKCTDPRARLSVVIRLRNAGISWSIVTRGSPTVRNL